MKEPTAKETSESTKHKSVKEASRSQSMQRHQKRDFFDLDIPTFNWSLTNWPFFNWNEFSNFEYELERRFRQMEHYMDNARKQMMREMYRTEK